MSLHRDFFPYTTADMADSSHDGQPILPTAVDIHESTFPFPKTNSPQSTPPTQSERVSTDAGAPVNPVDKAGAGADTVGNGTSNTRNGRKRYIPRAYTADNANRRPSVMRKFQTHIDRPQARPPAIKKRQTAHGKPKPQLGRQATLSFDPYSSDSSSSSSDDDDETAKHERLDAGQFGEDRSTRKRRAGGGPFSTFKISHDDFNTKGRVSKRDGRLKLHINEHVDRGYFAKTLGAKLQKTLQGKDSAEEPAKSSVAWQDEDGGKISPEDDIMEDPQRRVKLNIVVIVIGSRGDIQPFLKIGKILKEQYGHRVRIATHPAFRDFVEKDTGLEFFSVGGNPSELMAFMVKNPGLIPSLDTIKEGEIGRRRAAMYDMFNGMWRACINSTDDETDYANLKMSKFTFSPP